jgi:hypothetical protein
MQVVRDDCRIQNHGRIHYPHNFYFYFVDTRKILSYKFLQVMVFKSVI